MRRQLISPPNPPCVKSWAAQRQPTDLQSRVPGSQPLLIGTNLDNLVQSLILRHVEIILLSNGRRHESGSFSVAAPGPRNSTRYAPASDKVSAFEELHKRFGRCQANQCSRLEGTAQTRLWWAFLDIPRRGRIDSRYRKLCLLHGLDDSRERFTDFTGETETYETISGMRRPRQHGCLNEPKTASTIWSVDLIAPGKSSVKGISKSSSCFVKRWKFCEQ